MKRLPHSRLCRGTRYLNTSPTTLPHLLVLETRTCLRVEVDLPVSPPLNHALQQGYPILEQMQNILAICGSDLFLLFYVAKSKAKNNSMFRL